MFERRMLILCVVAGVLSCKTQSTQDTALGDSEAVLRVEPASRYSYSSMPNAVLVRLTGPREFTTPVSEILEFARLNSLTTGDVWDLKMVDSSIPEVYSNGEGFVQAFEVPAMPDGEYEIVVRLKSWGHLVSTQERYGSVAPRNPDGFDWRFAFSLSSMAFFVESATVASDGKLSLAFSENFDSTLEEIQSALRVSAGGKTLNCTVRPLDRSDVVIADCSDGVASPLKIEFTKEVLFSAEGHKYLASHHEWSAHLSSLVLEDSQIGQSEVSWDQP